MSLPATLRGSFFPISNCSSCSNIQFQRFAFSPIIGLHKQRNVRINHCSRRFFGPSRELYCKVTGTETEPDGNNDEEKVDEEGERPSNSEPNSQPVVVDQDTDQSVDLNVLETTGLANESGAETIGKVETEGDDEVQVASGSPLPGLKPQQLDESMRISKGTIDILRDQVFGFDTFFVTSQEPYEGGVLFKGNLRGQPAKSYEKIKKRILDRFGDQYLVFLLINPEDDKPVAVVVPRKTLQPDTTAVPEWFAAGAFALVTVFTLFLRNVPALQSNVLSIFEDVNLLKDGLPGALVTALILGVHEISHFVVAQRTGIKLGVPYFVPSWQIGSYGAITRILNIVPKREDLLKFASAGPVAGFSLGFVLLLLGFILPPTDGIGVVVDASVFHESLLVGGIAKLLLGDVLKEGSPLSVNPLVIWAWAGLLINAINSIPAGELDGGRIAFAIWGRKASARFTGASIVLLGLSSLFSDVAFYWVVLIFFLQRGPIAPLSEEITDPDNKYVALGITILFLGLLICLPYPFAFTSDTMNSF